MAQNTIVQTVGDSLREVAAMLDRVPSIVVSAINEHQPVRVTSIMRSSSSVETIGALLGMPVTESMAESGHVTTRAEMFLDRVHLDIFHVAEPVQERELRRPAEVTESLAERDL